MLSVTLCAPNTLAPPPGASLDGSMVMFRTTRALLRAESDGGMAWWGGCTHASQGMRAPQRVKSIVIQDPFVLLAGRDHPSVVLLFNFY